MQQIGIQRVIESDPVDSPSVSRLLTSNMNKQTDAKLGSTLAVAGIVLLLVGGIGMSTGRLAMKSLRPGYVGVALMMEIVGLGLREKAQDT